MSKLSKEQRLARLQEKHNKIAREKGDSWKEIDGMLSVELTATERELGFPIMGDYPLMKFITQVGNLRYIKERENEQARR